MIEFKGTGFTYDGERFVLDGVDARIERGEFVCILGGNGSGKSTLAKHVNALLVPDEGSVTVLDRDTRDERSTYFIRSNAGMVFQNPDDQLVASLIENDVAFGPENLGVPTDQLRQRVADALADVGLQGFDKRETAALSGGQKQKVAIASVLALNPRVLVLDEPTAELDPLSSRTVFDLLARYAREHGATVVVVEQKIALLSQYADMLVIVDEGKIRFADAPAQVLEHSDELKAIGVNCPRSTTLMNRLRAEGLYAGAPVRNVREAREALKEVLA